MKRIYNLSINFDNPNHKRILFLLNNMNFKFKERSLFFDKQDAIFVCDLQSNFDIILTIFISIFRKDKNFIFLILELYSIDLLAFVNERINYYFIINKFNKNYFNIFLKHVKNIIGTLLGCLNLIIINILLFIKNKQTKVFIIVPSSLRRDYLKIFYFRRNLNYFVLQNKMIYSDLIKTKSFLDIFNSKNYLVLSGRVNDLETIHNLSIKLNCTDIKILIAGAQDLSKDFNFTLYKNIEFLGVLNHLDMMRINFNSLAGLVIYSNSTINQRLSASSKLYEYISLGIPLIISNNLGAITELKSINIPYIIIDEILNDNFPINNLINQLKILKKDIINEHLYDEAANIISKEFSELAI
jgi:hypothetical protein